MPTTVRRSKLRFLTKLLLQWRLVSKINLFSNVYYSQGVKIALFDQVITSVKTSIKKCTFFKCLPQSKGQNCAFWPIITSVGLNRMFCTCLNLGSLTIPGTGFLSRKFCFFYNNVKCFAENSKLGIWPANETFYTVVK